MSVSQRKSTNMVGDRQTVCYSRGTLRFVPRSKILISFRKELLDRECYPARAICLSYTWIPPFWRPLHYYTPASYLSLHFPRRGGPPSLYSVYVAWDGRRARPWCLPLHILILYRGPDSLAPSSEKKGPSRPSSICNR